MKPEKHFFTCKECGCHELRVVREGLYANMMRESMDCTCGRAKDELAYFKKYITYDSFHEEYVLEEYHEFDNNIIKDINCCEEPEDTEIEEELYCGTCYKERDAYNIETEILESESFVEKEEYKVICDKCRREIEFEWFNSTIWPVECSDFHLMGAE